MKKEDKVNQIKKEKRVKKKSSVNHSDKKELDKNSSTTKKVFRISKKKLVVSLIILIAVALLLFFWRDIFPKKEVGPVVYDKMYNGYLFYFDNATNLWSVAVRTPAGKVPVEFYFHPQQLTDFKYNYTITKDFTGIMLMKGKFFIGYDTALANAGIAAVAGSEVAKITGKVFGVETKSGFVGDVGEASIPIVNCSMANYKNMVLEFRMSDESKIVYNNRCITIYAATQEDLVRGADFIVYNLLGVITGSSIGDNQTISKEVSTASNNSSDNVTV